MTGRELKGDMSEEMLEEILREGEGYRTEFKEGLSKDIDREMVAFANSSGGKILLGVDDSGNVVGISKSNDIISKIHTIARNCDPPVDISVETYGKIIVIDVKEGERKPYRCSKGFFIRDGANSQKLTTEEIAELMRYEGKIRFDEILRPEIDVEEHLSPERLEKFMDMAGISNLLNHSDILYNLGAARRKDGKTVMNNAGLLFFAKDPWQVHFHSAVICALYKGRKKVDILDRKDLKGDIIENIEDAMIFLKRHLNLRYEIGPSRRKEVLEIPEVALKEAVTNAVCHRNYFEKGANVMIEVFDDRVEISSPGGLPKPLSEKDFGKRSVARNPIIAMLLNRAGYIEKSGTGIERMRNAMKEAGMPEPEFEFDGFFTVILRRNVKVTPQVTPQVTTEVTPQVLTMLKACMKPLSREEIMEILGLSDRENLRKSYIKPALEAGWLAMTIPDKPRSSRQRYVTTERGRAVIEKKGMGGEKLHGGPQLTPQDTPQVLTMLEACMNPLSRDEILDALGISDRKHLREAYIKPALEAGWLAMTIPDKPRSSKQRYVTTEAGKKALEKAKKRRAGAT